jgi:hypothetical protein
VVPSPTVSPTTPATLACPQLHTAFLSILPRIETHARVCSRGVRCPHSREEFRAEVVALCWQWFVRLVEKGKDPLQFPTTLAAYAARAVRSGRRLCGQERSKEVMSPLAQRRRGFRVGPLPTSTRRPHDGFHGRQAPDAFEERLRDNAVTPPPDAAAFRIDFPDWLRTRTARDRRLIEDLMRDERTLDLAGKHGLSPSRVSQLRRQFLEDWRHFCGEALPSRESRVEGVA